MLLKYLILYVKRQLLCSQFFMLGQLKFLPNSPVDNHHENVKFCPWLFLSYFSVLSFVENGGDYAVSMVDNLLDILTKGEHAKTKMFLEQVNCFILIFWFTSPLSEVYTKHGRDILECNPASGVFDTFLVFIRSIISHLSQFYLPSRFKNIWNYLFSAIWD